jgi:type IV pilus assembly protein PilN
MPVRIPVNLASLPFRRKRTLIVASIAIGVVLSGTLGVLISLIVAQRHEQADTRMAIDRLDQRVAVMAHEQAVLEATLRRPENAEVLDRSLFLNTLLYRKGISWTLIFADLEKVVPYNVRLISVHPQATPENDVSLDMVVGAESYEPVIEMLKQMESSPLFGETAVHATVPPTQNDPLFKYRVSVNYAQKWPTEQEDKLASAQEAKGPSEQVAKGPSGQVVKGPGKQPVKGPSGQVAK